MTEITEPQKAITDKSTWYIKHKIPKRSGGVRLIEEPVEWLKKAQRDIYENILLPNFRLSKYAFGSVKNRSIADAAAPHVASKRILRIDLKDFFGTVTASAIAQALEGNDRLDPEVKSLVCMLSVNEEGVLPQGGVTSPAIANICASKMYNQLALVAERMDLKFTAYLDDMIFSGDAPGRIIPLVEKIAEANGFKINKKKTIVMNRKQEVLGLCARNTLDHTRLPRRKRNKIRGLLHRLRWMAINKKMDHALLKHTTGLVAFAHMAKDQKAPLFRSKLKEIKELMAAKDVS